MAGFIVQDSNNLKLFKSLKSSLSWDKNKPLCPG